MNKVNQSTEYGYISSNEKTNITVKKGKYVSGYSVGILCLDECSYPVLPGNVANLTTYNFPVVTKVVKNCTQERIHIGDPSLIDDILKAAKQMEEEGAKAICGACGFFGNFQSQVAEAVDIPVFLSSIIQIPWIKTGLKSNQQIGVLTADAEGISESLLQSCGVNCTDNIVLKDLKELSEFSAIIDSRGNFDNQKLQEEVLQATSEMMDDNPDIGAILLECSDLPPYAADIQNIAHKPVFDFITMINWVHMATAQKPYSGFI